MEKVEAVDSQKAPSTIARNGNPASGKDRAPVIRQCADRSLFPLNFNPEGVALFPEELVLFKVRGSRLLPDSVFAARTSEDLKAVPKLKVKHAVPWGSVEELTVRRRGTVAFFNGRAEGKKLSWYLPLSDSRGMVEGCAHILEECFESRLHPDDFAVLRTRSRAWIGPAIVLLLLEACFLAWTNFGKIFPGEPPRAEAPAVERDPQNQRMTVDQALARHAEIVFHRKAADGPYHVRLSPGWKATVEPDGDSTFQFQNGSNVSFGVSVLHEKQSEPVPDVGQARTAFEALVYGEKPKNEDEMEWLQREQTQRAVTQGPTVTRDGRPWTDFEATDKANQRVWRAAFTDGPRGGYLVFGRSPVNDPDGKMRALLDAAFHDIELPAAAAEQDQARTAAREAAYRAALRDSKAVAFTGQDPAFVVTLGPGWRELPLEGGDRQYLLANNSALTVEVHAMAPFMTSSEAHDWFLGRIGCKDHPDWPTKEYRVTKEDGRIWREWRADTEDHDVATHWRGRWNGDLEHSYFLVSRTWDQTPEIDPLATELIDQAFSNFARAPLHTNEYRGGARPYVFRLPGEWKPIDLSANGFDKAWEGPSEMVLRVETGPGTFTPAHLPALVAAARENFAKTYRLGPSTEAGRWVRFRADIDIDEKAYACMFSLTVTANAYYMVSVVVPTANLERCEPLLTDVLDSIELPQEAAPPAPAQINFR